MTDDLQQARLEATARALDPIAWGRYDLLAYAKNPWPSRDLIVEHSLSSARAALAAADAVVTADGLQERIEDTLAYYQCRETNPKADHPSMGYHAFSEEQREFLRARKSEAAAEIIRMILALLRGGEDGDPR